jgi:hypothetical protein
MTVESASTFLASTILVGSGVILLCIILVIINNIFSKFWKPVRIWLPNYMTEPHRFATHEEIEKIAPHFDGTINTNSKEKK